MNSLGIQKKWQQLAPEGRIQDSEEVGHPTTTAHRVCRPLISLVVCRFFSSSTPCPGPAARSPERGPVLFVLRSLSCGCCSIHATFPVAAKGRETCVALGRKRREISQVRHLVAPCRKPRQLRGQYAHGREPTSSAGRCVRRPHGRLWVSAHRVRPCINSDATHDYQ